MSLQVTSSPLSAPVNRSMQVLDRTFFRKTLPLAAATVFEDKNLSHARAKIFKSGSLLKFHSTKLVVPDETVPGRKCILLGLGVNATDSTTWSSTITELVENKIIGLRPYELTLVYKDWTTHEILEAILPEPEEDEDQRPAGFAAIGHVAHLNLREQYLPYKHLIAQVLLDKTPGIRTVINKLEDVGSTNVYRTFPYEVLAGPDDLNVTLEFANCKFSFDFAKVYYNPRLNYEHERLLGKFEEGEAVCDVMAGIGPFAIPAGKKGVFVHANDLNPDSKSALSLAISVNKVHPLVFAYQMDGRNFVRDSALELQRESYEVTLTSQVKPLPPHLKPKVRGKQIINLRRPRSFQHYVMNLPASAVEFLDAFKGLYVGRRSEFEPLTDTKLPLIHVYCFLDEQETESLNRSAVCALVSKHLGHEITPDTPDTDIHLVRKVSPKKQMFCASLRLPAEVAFAGE